MRTVMKRMSIICGTLFLILPFFSLAPEVAAQNGSGINDNFRKPAPPKAVKRATKKKKNSPIPKSTSARGPLIASVVSASSYLPELAPGSLISIFGKRFLARNTEACTAPSNSSTIPLTLCNIEVSVEGGKTGGVAIPKMVLPLLFVNSTQINAQVPYELFEAAQKEGLITVRVKTKSGSSTLRVPLSYTAPGILSQDSSGTGLGVISHFDHGVFQPWTLITTSQPARPGETVVIYMTGLGGTGVTGQVDNIQTKTTETVDIVLSRGSAGTSGIGSQYSQRYTAPAYPVVGNAGLYQVNFQIPNAFPWNATEDLGPVGVIAFSRNPITLKGNFSQRVLLPLTNK